MTTSTQNSSEFNPDDIRVGATIKQMREMRGMTQEELARSSLLSRPYLANIETGRKRPSQKAVAKIAAALQVPQISILAPDLEPAAA